MRAPSVMAGLRPGHPTLSVITGLRPGDPCTRTAVRVHGFAPRAHCCPV